MASILITDTPIIQALEAQNSPEFDKLWSILQSEAVDGYITPNDLYQLDHHLHRSVGPGLAQQLVVGFRSVLSLYGESDSPAIDLIIDVKYSDGIDGEPPTRSVSDFLCIYELELLLTASPGDEIHTDSLFSSLAEIVEVLEGEDAFIAKAWLDAVVPIEDAPVFATVDEAPHEHSTEYPITEIAQNPKHHDDAQEAEDGDCSDSDNVSTGAEADQANTSSLSPVMQTILRKGQSPSLSQPGAGSLERPELAAPFTYSLTHSAYAHHPIHDFNVDMFLILGLIMDMRTHAKSTSDNSSGFTLTLLNHPAVLSRNESRNEDLQHSAESITTSTNQQHADHIQLDHQGVLLPLASSNTIAPVSIAAEKLVHLARKRIDDRSFELAPLQRDRPRRDKTASAGLNTNIKKARNSQSQSSATPITPNTTSYSPSSYSPSHVSFNRLTHPSPERQRSLINTAVATLGEAGSRQANSIAPEMATDESMTMAPMLRGNPSSILSPNPTPPLHLLDKPSPSYGNLNKAASNLKKSIEAKISTFPTLATEKNSILAGKRQAIAQYLAQQPQNSPLSNGSSPSTTTTVPQGIGSSIPNSNTPENSPSILSREEQRDGRLLVPNIYISLPIHLPPRPDVVPIVEDNEPQEPTSEYEPITLNVNSDTTPQKNISDVNPDNEDTPITIGTASFDRQSADDDIDEGYLSLSTWDIEGWGTEIWESSHTFSSDNDLGLIVVHAGTNTFNTDKDNAFVLLNGGSNTFYGSQRDTWFVLDGGENIIQDENGQNIFEVYEGTNQIKGGNGGDWFVLAGGNNIVAGENGQDKVGISAGNNIVDGGNGHDWVLLDGGDNTVNGRNGNDTILIRAGDNIVKGGNGHDLIHIYGGKNAINAGSGNDIVVADYGFDLKSDTPWTLTGSNGKDTFVIAHASAFENASDLHDQLDHVVITDFEQGQDTIELYEWSELITLEDLSLHQVGVNTHIMVEDELWTVVEDVDQSNLHLTEEWYIDPVAEEIDVRISIRWENQLSSQSLDSHTRSHSINIMDNAWRDWPYPTPYELATPSDFQPT